MVPRSLFDVSYALATETLTLGSEYCDIYPEIVLICFDNRVMSYECRQSEYSKSVIILTC